MKELYDSHLPLKKNKSKSNKYLLYSNSYDAQGRSLVFDFLFSRMSTSLLFPLATCLSDWSVNTSCRITYRQTAAKTD